MTTLPEDLVERVRDINASFFGTVDAHVAARAALEAVLERIPCPDCAGRGYAYQCDDPADESVRCSFCRGSGVLWVAR